MCFMYARTVSTLCICLSVHFLILPSVPTTSGTVVVLSCLIFFQFLFSSFCFYLFYWMPWLICYNLFKPTYELADMFFFYSLKIRFLVHGSLFFHQLSAYQNQFIKLLLLVLLGVDMIFQISVFRRIYKYSDEYGVLFIMPFFIFYPY